MAYRDDILALNPDHYWPWDGSHADLGFAAEGARNTGTNGIVQLNGIPITEDSGASFYFDTFTRRTECADSNVMNVGQHTKRSMGGWFRPEEIAKPPSAIYKEGGGTNNFAILIGYGNNLIAQAVDAGDFDIQAFSDRPLTPGRSYHVLFLFSGSGQQNRFNLYVDGVVQSITAPAPPTPNKVTMTSHIADVTWGDPDSNINVGGSSAGFAAAIGNMAHWATWTETLTDQQIREELFEKGALPTHIVTSQADLDALVNSTISETPLAIRVDVAGNIDLNADNIFFDQASIDIQYTGTGVLNWTNNGTSNAAIVSTPNGGTVNIIKTYNITFSINFDGALPVDYEWRLYETSGAAGYIGQVELAGSENETQQIINYSFEHSVDKPATLQIIADGYRESVFELNLLATDQQFNVPVFVDTNL